VQSLHDDLDRLKQRLGHVLEGKSSLIEKTLACLLAGGHLLLEGPPGTGKTSLAKGLAASFEGALNRIQMTSDLLPSDIVGILRVKPGGQDFEFRPGPIFTNFLLADELNRTTPKTQSALLEAMEEGTVTVDGKSHPLPSPFFVVATQNPLEYHGVYPLAESQLDRFMMLLEFTPPTEDDELRIYRKEELRGKESGSNPDGALSLDWLSSTREKSGSIHLEESLLRYISKIIRATREIPGIGHGVSVRGGLQFIQAVQALALVRGRDYAVPQDVIDLAPDCLAHRLFFSGVETERAVKAQMIREILSRIEAPR
jgi:MoxR-like ATPase